MADEITFGYSSGRTLTYGCWNPDGTEVTASGTALTEDPANKGYYHADNSDIVSLDVVIVSDSVLGVVGWGEFQPQFGGSTGGTVIHNYSETITGPVDQGPLVVYTE